MRRLLLLASAMLATWACAAPVALTGQAAVKLPSIGGVRKTHPSENVNLAPVWVSVPASVSFLAGTAGNLDLNAYTLDGNDDPLTVTVQAGSDVMTALGLALASGVVTGANPIAGSGSVTFRVCDDEPLCADTVVAFTVSALPTPDTTPDQFTFTAVSSAPLNTATACPAITISGINAAATTTVSTSGSTGSPELQINGGAWITGPTTVTNGQTVAVRRVSAAGNEQTRAVTLTVGGVSADCSIITFASPVRVGIIYTLSGETMAAAFNPPIMASGLMDDPVDGVRIQHVAQTSPVDYGASAQVRALPHFEILSGSSGVFQGLDSDNHWFRGTLYQCSTNSPAVDYAILNGGPGGQANDNKPRINIQAATALEAIHLHYRTQYEIGAAYGLDANYVADSIASREFIFQLTGQHHSGQTSGGGKNNLELSVSGGTSTSCSGCIGAEFFVERYLNGSSRAKHRLPITASMRGKWIYHYFLIDMDNRTSGASPQFEWVVEVIDPTTRARISTTVVVNDSTTTWGLDDTQDPGGFSGQWNLHYKPAWCGQSSPGTYGGSKHSPIVGMLDAIRIGSASAGYGDVHPLRLSHP